MYQKFENKNFTADNKARAFIESKKLKKQLLIELNFYRNK